MGGGRAEPEVHGGRLNALPSRAAERGRTPSTDLNWERWPGLLASAPGQVNREEQRQTVAHQETTAGTIPTASCLSSERVNGAHRLSPVKSSELALTRSQDTTHAMRPPSAASAISVSATPMARRIVPVVTRALMLHPKRYRRAGLDTR